ncbi:MAG: hypothetical protein WCV50_02050 [Patescibacteria group bacterium]|jgi:butyrate kinase
MEKIILGINPGGSGNEFTLANAESSEIIFCDKTRPAEPYPPCVEDQLPLRQQELASWLTEKSNIIGSGCIVAVVSRGPALLPDAKGRPNGFGIYGITDEVINAINRKHLYTIHASQLAPIMAKHFSLTHGNVPAIFVDPISGQILPEGYRLSGLPGVERRPLGHWLNIHYILRSLFSAGWMDKSIIACHFGTGTTIAGFRSGSLVNVNDANAGGPFSDTRAGSLPTEPFLDWIAAELAKSRTVQHIKEQLQTKCGLAGHLGVRDLAGARQLLNDGNEHARLVYDTMICNIGAEIMGRVVEIGYIPDALILTGGMCQDKQFVADVQQRISQFIPKRFHCIHPGSFEAQAMVNAGCAVLNGEAEPILYGK